VVLLLVSW